MTVPRITGRVVSIQVGWPQTYDSNGAADARERLWTTSFYKKPVSGPVFVGRTTRTNAAAIEQLREAIAPFGYVTKDVSVHGCLHLKSAVTALSEDMLLVDIRSVDAEPFGAFDLVGIDPEITLGW